MSTVAAGSVFAALGLRQVVAVKPKPAATNHDELGQRLPPEPIPIAGAMAPIQEVKGDVVLPAERLGRVAGGR